MVTEYNEISRGTLIQFSCLTGLVLTGPNLSICMGNGEWEPDPREAQCKGERISGVHVDVEDCTCACQYSLIINH